MVANAGPRRPGWSRKARLSLFLTFIGTIAAMVVGLILLIWSLAAPDSFRSFKGAALDIVSPIASGMDNVTRTTRGLVGGAEDYWDAARQNGRLKRDRDQMMRRMVEAKAIALENEELKRVLALREVSERHITTGRIVGSSFESPRRFAIYSRGTSDGIEIGMPVRSPEGLLGRIVTSGRLNSRIMLISDRASFVPVKRITDGLPAMAQGMGDGRLAIRPLEVGRNPFRPGDVMVTSGTGGLYAPSIPVAKVVRLNGDDAIAAPIADPAYVNFASATAIYEPLAMDSAATLKEE